MLTVESLLKKVSSCTNKPLCWKSV